MLLAGEGLLLKQRGLARASHTQQELGACQPLGSSTALEEVVGDFHFASLQKITRSPSKDQTGRH